MRLRAGLAVCVCVWTWSLVSTSRAHFLFVADPLPAFRFRCRGHRECSRHQIRGSSLCVSCSCSPAEYCSWQQTSRAPSWQRVSIVTLYPRVQHYSKKSEILSTPGATQRLCELRQETGAQEQELLNPIDILRAEICLEPPPAPLAAGLQRVRRWGARGHRCVPAHGADRPAPDGIAREDEGAIQLEAHSLAAVLSIGTGSNGTEPPSASCCPGILPTGLCQRR